MDEAHLALHALAVCSRMASDRDVDSVRKVPTMPVLHHVLQSNPIDSVLQTISSSFSPGHERALGQRVSG